MDEQPGYTPEELDKGEDQAWHMPLWGCLGFIALVGAATWLLLR